MYKGNNLVYDERTYHYMDTVRPTPDHDLLISLNVKVDRLTVDVRDGNQDTSVRVAKIETRLDNIDNYHAGIDLPHFKANSEFVDGLKANWKFIIGFGTVILTVIQVLIAVGVRVYFK